MNIHSYKDDGITDEEYACQPSRGGIDTNDPDWFRKSVEFAKTQKDWYSWNNSNWGTKWDVAVRDGDEYPETELLEYKSEGDDNWVIYKYETAWSPAVTILTKLSQSSSLRSSRHFLEPLAFNFSPTIRKELS